MNALGSAALDDCRSWRSRFQTYCRKLNKALRRAAEGGKMAEDPGWADRPFNRPAAIDCCRKKLDQSRAKHLPKKQKECFSLLI